MNRFLLIDDHFVVRAGLKLIITGLVNPCEIDEAENGNSAMAQLKEKEYDVAILDIKMPNTNTLDLMQIIKDTYPNLKVLIYSMNSESIYARRFIKAGAKGFVNKDAPLEDVKKAILLVLSGKKYISDTMLELLADFSSSSEVENLFNSLSPREFEIVSLLLKGVGVSHIATSLNLQVSTIGTHKARIFEKLKVTNMMELKEMAASYSL